MTDVSASRPQQLLSQNGQPSTSPCGEWHSLSGHQRPVIIASQNLRHPYSPSVASAVVLPLAQHHVSAWNGMKALIQAVLNLLVSLNTSVIGVYRQTYQTKNIRQSFAHTSKNSRVASLALRTEHHAGLIETLKGLLYTACCKLLTTFVFVILSFDSNKKEIIQTYTVHVCMYISACIAQACTAKSMQTSNLVVNRI